MSRLVRALGQWLPVLVLPALAFSVPAVADSPPEAGRPVYAVSRVVAHGGNPIREVVGGVVYERRFDSDCRLLPGLGPLPFSGRLGDAVELELEVAGCPRGAPAPEVRCRWRIAPAGDPRAVDFDGSQATFDVAMPARTGERRFELDCRLPGDSPAQRLEFPLFVTYGQALTFFGQPPPLEWYRLATRFAPGFDAAASENNVVRAIQAGLYAYGQERWRYGYCRPARGGEGACVFPQGPCRPCRDPNLICDGDPCDPAAKCKCSPDAVLDPASGCNFTDCYGFTAILRTLSATQGIGGFRDCEICGAFDLGFVTRPERRSSDPRFPGNLLCTPDDRGCRYLFRNHSLTYLNGELYDATFGAVYERAEQAISWSVLENLGHDMILEDRQAACFRRDGYGTWPYYDQRLRTHPGVLPCPQDPSRPASVTEEGPVELRLIEVNGEQRVAVDVALEIRAEGRYRLFGALFAGETAAAVRSAWEFEESPVVSEISAGPGRYTMRLIFSSEEVYEFENFALSQSLCGSVACGVTDRPGPIDQLKLNLFSDRGLVERLAVPVVAPSQDFLDRLTGARSARFVDRLSIDGRGVDPSRNGRFNALRVTAAVHVVDAGSYTLVGRLARGDFTITYTVVPLQLTVGRQQVGLSFPGAEIAAHSLAGEYRVTLAIYRLEPPVRLAQTVARVIGRFEASDFE